MKTIPILLLLSFIFTLGGCVNWADQNKPVDFIPEVLKSISEAKIRPIQLTETQKTKLFSSLAGPVKKDFMGRDLNPEVFASWFSRRNDMVTLVRYEKAGERYVFITYDTTGRVFAFGGGQIEGGNPPWLK
jgi:hypothetical protein